LDEFDSERFAALPGDLTGHTCARVTRVRKPENFLNGARVVDDNLRTVRRLVDDCALACCKSTVEGDPPWLVDALAGFALEFERHDGNTLDLYRDTYHLMIDEAFTANA
jgi:hypothetical protein